MTLILSQCVRCVECIDYLSLHSYTRVGPVAWYHHIQEGSLQVVLYWVKMFCYVYLLQAGNCIHTMREKAFKRFPLLMGQNNLGSFDGH